MRLPKINVEEPGWAQFLVGMFIFAPIIGAIVAGRWVADTLADQTTLILAIAAFVLSWLFMALSARLAHPSRPSIRSLIAGDGALASVMFGMVVLIAYRDWVFLAIMIGITMAIFSTVAYRIDHRRALAINEDGDVDD